MNRLLSLNAYTVLRVLVILTLILASVDIALMGQITRTDYERVRCGAVYHGTWNVPYGACLVIDPWDNPGPSQMELVSK